SGIRPTHVPGYRATCRSRPGGPAGLLRLRYANMSNLVRFQPEILTTTTAPCRSAEFHVTVRGCESPGNSVMSLFCHIEDCSSLSPESSWPLVVPRRMSARSRKATVELDVLLIVTVVARSAPSGPDWVVVVAEAVTEPCGSDCSDVRSAYCDSVACG